MAEQASLQQRSVSLAAAPIEVRSALDRKAKIFVPAEPPPAPVKIVDFETETDDDADNPPEWPDDAAEDAMRAELANRSAMGGGAPKTNQRSRAGADTLEGGPLPDLDSLVAEIPDAVKHTLEELFRAQFLTVRRVPAAVLKPEIE